MSSSPRPRLAGFTVAFLVISWLFFGPSLPKEWASRINLGAAFLFGVGTTLLLVGIPFRPCVIWKTLTWSSDRN